MFSVTSTVKSYSVPSLNQPSKVYPFLVGASGAVAGQFARICEGTPESKVTVYIPVVVPLNVPPVTMPVLLTVPLNVPPAMVPAFSTG